MKIPTHIYIYIYHEQNKKNARDTAIHKTTTSKFQISIIPGYFDFFITRLALVAILDRKTMLPRDINSRRPVRPCSVWNVGADGWPYYTGYVPREVSLSAVQRRLTEVATICRERCKSNRTVLWAVLRNVLQASSLEMQLLIVRRHMLSIEPTQKYRYLCELRPRMELLHLWPWSIAYQASTCEFYLSFLMIVLTVLLFSSRSAIGGRQKILVPS